MVQKKKKVVSPNPFVVRPKNNVDDELHRETTTVPPGAHDDQYR